MTLELHCGDVIPGCAGVVNGSTQAEVLDRAAAHAAEAHGLSSLDADTEAALSDAIRPA